jgi:ribosomal protein L10
VGGQKNGLEVTVGTLPMKNETIRVYFGELQIRMTAKLIRILQMMRAK